jgi:hypothetical protein
MCICQSCKTEYQVDFHLKDDLWAKITPSSVDEAGLLCPSCIGKRINDLEPPETYKLFRMTKIDGIKYSIRFYISNWVANIKIFF